MKTLRNNRVTNREGGASLIEFALLAPLLILLLLGIVEFGWKFGQFNDVRHGTREGARFAAVDAGSNTDIRDHVCDSMDLDAGVTSLEIELSEGGGDVGDTGWISVTASVDSLTGAPLISVFLPSELSSRVDFRLEQDADSWGDTGGTPLTCP